MPRDPFKPLNEKEQRFVFHFARERYADERLNLVARKCRIPEEEAKSIHRRAHVQAEIERRRNLVEFEEHRLMARDAVGAARQEEERERVSLSDAEKAIKKVLDLDPKDHSGAILDAVKLVMVYTGTIRDGNRVKIQNEKLDPAQTPLDAGGPMAAPTSFYQSIFAQEREAGAAPSAPAEEPAPLLPDPESPAAKPRAPTPPPPKPAATPKRTGEKIIQVEIT
jgi:hypothetical protein